MSADTALGIFFGRYADCLCEGFEEVAVIRKSAFFIGFGDAGAVPQEGFGDADSAGADVFVDGGAGGRFENPADIGFA